MERMAFQSLAKQQEPKACSISKPKEYYSVKNVCGGGEMTLAFQ